MTASLNLTVNASRAELNDYIRSSTDPRGECLALERLFKRLASGTISGSVIAQKAAVAAVRASGTVTITHGNLNANDTVTICGITITAKASGATGAQFNIGADATADAAALAACINALATLNIYVSATSAAGVVTVTANQAGVVGNLFAMATSDATAYGLSAAALAGGAGGANSAPVTYSRGL
jgi:phage tail sheath gpL-like